MTRHRSLLISITLLTLAALLAAPALLAAEDPALADLLDLPDTRWRNGPVKYLLSKAEAKAYRKLKSEEERLSWIEAFWSRRDPVPETLENEFKERYAARLEKAAEQFAPPKGRGWEEDRAKVVALLGIPDGIEIRSSQGAGGGPGGNDQPTLRRKALFSYEREVAPGAPVPLELEFIEDPYGGFRLVSKFEFSHPRLTGLEPDPVVVAAATPPPPPPEPEPEPVPVEPEPEPTAQELLMSELLAGDPPESALSIATRLDFYKTTEAATFATLTVAVKGAPAEGEEPLVAARFTPADGAEDPEGEDGTVPVEAEDSFAPSDLNATAGDGVPRIYQARVNLAPGTYVLAAAVKNSGTGELGFIQREIAAPDFQGEELQLSTVTLARKVEQLRGAAEDPEARYLMGNVKVIPAPSGEFRPGQDVWIYYQIYNTANDPGSGGPKLKITYQYEFLKDGRSIKIGAPIVQTVSTSVQAYAVGVADVWPKGDYQIIVTVEDLVAGKSASTTVPFTVFKEEA